MQVSSIDSIPGSSGCPAAPLGAVGTPRGLPDIAPLRAMIFMLSRVALDPRKAHQQAEDLKSGLVRLEFFGVSNPVPFFLAFPSDPDYQAMLSAIEENRRGPLGAAALRVLKWNSPSRQAQRLKREVAIMARFQASLTWPVGDPFSGFSDSQREENSRLLAQMEAKRAQLRDTRFLRLAALRRAAEPGIGSYHRLVEDLKAQRAITVH